MRNCAADHGPLASGGIVPDGSPQRASWECHLVRRAVRCYVAIGASAHAICPVLSEAAVGEAEVLQQLLALVIKQLT